MARSSTPPCLRRLLCLQGQIAEMRTGEGKTLVAVLPAFLNALTGALVGFKAGTRVTLRAHMAASPCPSNLS